MNRIAVFKGDAGTYPKESDFEDYNAHILISRILTCHAVKKNDNVAMIHPYEFESIATSYGISTGYKEFMCQTINNLPENVWQQIINKLWVKNTKTSD
jgi:hypothetical protein